MCGCGSWTCPGSCDNDSVWQLWDSLSYTMERRCLQELGEVWMLPVPSTGLLTCLIIAIKPQFFVFKHAHWIIIDAVSIWYPLGSFFLWNNLLHAPSLWWLILEAQKKPQPLLKSCHSGAWCIRMQGYFQGLFVSTFSPFGSWLQLFDLKIKILDLDMFKSRTTQCLCLLQRHWFTVTFIIVLSFPLYCAPLSLR